MHINMETSYTTAVKTLHDDYDDDPFDDVDSRRGDFDSISFVRSVSDDMDAKGKGCTDETPTSMADNIRAKKSLCDVPFSVTRDLMRSMDTDKGWEEVAAQAGFTFDRIQLLGLRLHQADGSPTRTLLWELGCLNFKVSDLYEVLREVNRRREMDILENYVKGAEEEEKAAAAAANRKLLESPFPSSLSYLNSQSKFRDQGAHCKSDFGYSSPGGSEMNFNHQSMMDKSRVRVGGAKNYDDKVIPGTEKQNAELASGFSMLSPALDSGNRLTDSLNKSLSAQVATSFHKRVPLLDSMEPGPKSLPSSLASSLKNGQAGHSPFSGGGGDHIRRMLGTMHHSPDRQSLPSSTSDNSGSAASPTSLGQTSQCKSSSNSQAGSSMSRVHGADSLTPSAISRTDSCKSDEDVAVSMKATYTYKELSTATDGFNESKLIGEGAFGKVYVGIIKHQECAIKRLNTKTANTADLSSQIKTELTALLKYQHENIVTLYGYALDGPELCLVYQHLMNGSLEDRLSRKNDTASLGWERRLNILVGACKGLSFLHTMGEKPLIHGDIKSANILLDKYLEAKIGDLGQAKYATSQSLDTTGFTHITIAESTTKQFGTKAYHATEVMSGGNLSLSVKSDVYAMGVVFLEVCSGLPAYDQDRAPSFLTSHFTEIVKPCPENEWAAMFRDKTMNMVSDENFVEVLKLANSCLNQSKKKRPDSVKLYNKVVAIYKSYREKTGEIEDMSSMSSIATSLQMDSHGSDSSLSQSQDSDQVLSEELRSLNLSSTQRDVQQLQQERLEQFHSLKPSSKPSLQLEPQMGKHPQASRPRVAETSDTGPLYQVEGMETVEMRKMPVSDLESPVENYHPSVQRLEAFRLQEKYDNQRDKKRIDRLSAAESQAVVEQAEEYPSDPVKLQSISEFDSEGQNSKLPFTSTPQPAEPTQEYPMYQSDPKKLEMLTGQDQHFQRYAARATESSESEVYACDPKKLEYLQNFDVGTYEQPKQTFQKECFQNGLPSLSDTTNKQIEEESSSSQSVATTELSVTDRDSTSSSYTPSDTTNISSCSKSAGGSNSNSSSGFSECRRPSSDMNVQGTNSGKESQDTETDGSMDSKRSAASMKMMGMFQKYNIERENYCGDEEEEEDNGEYEGDEGEADNEVEETRFHV